MDLPRTPSFRLDGRCALVTGGSRGIGLAAAVALAEAGAAVTIVARSADVVNSVVETMRAGRFAVSGVVLDVTDQEEMRALIGRCAPFDILVNSAGTSRHGPFIDIETDAYAEVMDLNLAATLFVSQAVARRLIEAKRPGSIINISSQMGHVSAPDRALYSASKFAVEGLTRGMAIELAPHDIRVNTLCPTFIETELTAKNLRRPEFRAWVLSKIKLGRICTVEDLMGPLLLLASDASRMMTGTSLMVDGGWTAE